MSGQGISAAAALLYLSQPNCRKSAPTVTTIAALPGDVSTREQEGDVCIPYISLSDVFLF